MRAVEQRGELFARLGRYPGFDDFVQQRFGHFIGGQPCGVACHQVLIEEAWDGEDVVVYQTLAFRDERLPENVTKGCPGRVCVLECLGFWNDGHDVGICVTQCVKALGARKTVWGFLARSNGCSVGGDEPIGNFAEVHLG